MNTDSVVLKTLMNVYKSLRSNYDPGCIASFPNWETCDLFLPGVPQWFEPAPGSGLQSHSHMTAGNPLSSETTTAQQDKTLVYLF